MDKDSVELNGTTIFYLLVGILVSWGTVLFLIYKGITQVFGG